MKFLDNICKLHFREGFLLYIYIYIYWVRTKIAREKERKRFSLSIEGHNHGFMMRKYQPIEVI
jgi:hypothetical protein